MSVSGQEQSYIRSRLQKVSMRSKIIPSWKVLNGAHKHHFPTPWSIIVRDYLYSHEQKTLPKKNIAIMIPLPIYSSIPFKIRWGEDWRWIWRGWGARWWRQKRVGQRKRQVWRGKPNLIGRHRGSAFDRQLHHRLQHRGIYSESHFWRSIHGRTHRVLTIYN